MRAGTNEYNLALGERRAAAVKDYLVSLGIAADRILAISKGEEEPLCTEMTEAVFRDEPARPFHHYGEIGFEGSWIAGCEGPNPRTPRTSRTRDLQFIDDCRRRGARILRRDNRPAHHDEARAGLDRFRRSHRSRLIVPLRACGRAADAWRHDLEVRSARLRGSPPSPAPTRRRPAAPPAASSARARCTCSSTGRSTPIARSASLVHARQHGHADHQRRRPTELR